MFNKSIEQKEYISWTGEYLKPICFIGDRKWNLPNTEIPIYIIQQIFIKNYADVFDKYFCLPIVFSSKTKKFCADSWCNKFFSFYQNHNQNIFLCDCIFKILLNEKEIFNYNFLQFSFDLKKNK